MQFPDFEDFIESLSKDDQMFIIGEVPSFRGNLLSSEGLTDFLARMNAYSSGKMIRTLEIYHRWLSEQLRNQQ